MGEYYNEEELRNERQRKNESEIVYSDKEKAQLSIMNKLEEKAKDNESDSDPPKIEEDENVYGSGITGSRDWK